MTLLVHLGAGIGDIVLATPLLLVLEAHGCQCDLALDADYPETASLFENWSAVRAVVPFSTARARLYDRVLPAVPPFYEYRHARAWRLLPNAVPRPPAALFERNRQAWYLEFARALGCDVSRAPLPRLPVAPSNAHGITARTLLLAPGSKTGEMAMKRWPGFAELAGEFEDAAVVGTHDDLCGSARDPLSFPPHVRLLAGRLSLRETAAAMAAAGAVAANDSGLAHLAAAAGAPVVMIFGPTPHLPLGPLHPWVTVLRSALPCEPCWAANRFSACDRRLDCLRSVRVPSVAEALSALVTIRPVRHPEDSAGA